MDGLPNFITHGAPLARFARRSSASIVCIVLDHRDVNFLTIVRANREAVTLPKLLNYSYARLKVARLDFLGLIPPKFEH